MTWHEQVLKLVASACFSYFLRGPCTLGRPLCYGHLNPCFRCSGLEKNVKTFSSAVVPLADSLKRSSDVAVKRAIACALERLSRDPYNCFLIHQHDALKVKWFLTKVNLLRLSQGAWISLWKKHWAENIYNDAVISYGVCDWLVLGYGSVIFSIPVTSLLNSVLLREVRIHSFYGLFLHSARVLFWCLRRGSLDSGSSGPGSSPGRGLSQCLSPPRCMNLMPSGNLRTDQPPIRGE